jgi:hypothetical protein
MSKLIDAFLKWTEDSMSWEILRIIALLAVMGLLVKACNWAWAD